ncbi:hypothetical protein BC832DRAFT_589997 [Gaertneriomyces semiglobifer]|nr:hypothetical protein BC832DRAFT_589997 [Gaertneriomyces semiglobifer]
MLTVSRSILTRAPRSTAIGRVFTGLTTITRNLSSSASRALTYAQYGPPRNVLKFQELPVAAITPSSVAIRFIAAPINPADINQIQGTYPVKPPFQAFGAVGGNEGLAVVTSVGEQVRDLKVGDWVIPAGSGFGTWRTDAVCASEELVKLHSDGVSEVMAATISVNPCTAFRMLHDFVSLKEGDVVVQNGGNSGVGQAVIQIAKSMGVKTVNVIRNRPNFDEVAESLKARGADIVITEEATRLPDTKKLLKSLGPPPRLALNCVGGASATNIARLLGQNGFLVTYGGMSKEPLKLPTSLFIFKNFTATGFWMTEWYEQHSKESRQEMLDSLFDLARKGMLREPHYEAIGFQTEDGIGAVSQALEGFGGKKVFFMDR